MLVNVSQNRNWVLWTHSDKPEKVDKPWEFLAACFELDDAYSLSDPTAFNSSLPCHQDGTCNGLQYYAALGRDLKGGKSVNLCNSDKPQDVYEEVLAVVKEKLEIDPSHSELRLFFQKFPSLLKRKTVKTTVRLFLRYLTSFSQAISLTFLTASSRSGHDLRLWCAAQSRSFCPVALS